MEITYLNTGGHRSMEADRVFVFVCIYTSDVNYVS
jgi:hypothetical protein